TLPLVLPGLASGWALAFINSFDEVTMTVFIAAPGTETLPVRMFLYIQDNIDPLVTSVSAAVIAVTVVALVALDRAHGLERLLVGRGGDVRERLRCRGRRRRPGRRGDGLGPRPRGLPRRAARRRRRRGAREPRQLRPGVGAEQGAGPGGVRRLDDPF